MEKSGVQKNSITKILIANRGEIAVRIARACKDSGISSVAIYADSDRDSLHVLHADEAYSLNGNVASETYLSIPKILEISKRSGADAIHPGYGFLSENAEFAQSVIDAGLIWIGPSPASIKALGDKVQARHIAAKVGAPLVPGTKDPVKNAQEVVEFANKYGLPIAIKAAFGGGGRGLKVARTQEEIVELYESAVREATAAFGRGECFVERYLDRPRHVETQCLADKFGNVVVISTRDCSLQRRHQKLVEEAPAPFLTDDQRRQLYDSSKSILKEANYEGAGTCEFLIGQDGTISFLEVNTRLQVEHPVSEEVTGIDLVREQIRIASGEKLGYHDPIVNGHSIEFRINGEDPGRNFLPAPGQLKVWKEPSGTGVRIDAGFKQGDVIGGNFDSLLAKLIVTGANRTEAIERAKRALSEFEAEGIATALPFHRAVLNDPAFAPVDPLQKFSIYTSWIESEFKNEIPQYQDSSSSIVLEDRSSLVLELNGKRIEITMPVGLSSGGVKQKKPPVARHQRTTLGSLDSDAVQSPMQGTVVKIAVKNGQKVSQGELLFVIEAMKMEQPISAHKDGVISDLSVEVGASVANGAVLLEIRDAS
ncbi:MAG: biotin/lipoyl-binding protein [Candidatus Nanopelagicales bacterium]|jgi:acetyl-CoA/propionyl-CoA carboxylase, biotin carboxylase, biotin carboxyl carrier protein|nr:biotin/lipoyl-binding protein [Candidatus Nanopelagicales bacterium]MDP4986330.1 biotin/lipoyl-binding protein [Candidatus Nanopelagicales bacterium]